MYITCIWLIENIQYSIKLNFNKSEYNNARWNINN